MSGFSASKSQRAKVRDMTCVWCARPGVDPAHLIPRSLTTVGQEDPRAVIPLCRTHHRMFDHGALDLLPALERDFRVELAFAVGRVGLATTVRRVTGSRVLEAA